MKVHRRCPLILYQVYNIVFNYSSGTECECQGLYLGERSAKTNRKVFLAQISEENLEAIHFDTFYEESSGRINIGRTSVGGVLIAGDHNHSRKKVSNLGTNERKYLEELAKKHFNSQ